MSYEELSIIEQRRLHQDLISWRRNDNHLRGCYLEYLARDLKHGNIRKEFVVEVLFEIAADMK